jgi:hypothetical protein
MNTRNSYSSYYISKCNQTEDKVNNKFVKWINEVEKHVFKPLQCLLLDLPDEAYMMNFEDKMTSKEMAEIVISSNMIFALNNAVTHTNVK